MGTVMLGDWHGLCRAISSAVSQVPEARSVKVAVGGSDALHQRFAKGWHVFR